MSIDAFKSKFNFYRAGAYYVGVERECFIVPQGGTMPVPRACDVLQQTKIHNPFTSKTPPTYAPYGYELSACQLETRTAPCTLDELETSLRTLEQELLSALERIGLSNSYSEVGPHDMPLDVYPDPTGRYQRITALMPEEILRAACRTIGTHIHIGMPNASYALHALNRTRQHIEELTMLGDHSEGRRLRLYKVVAPTPIPPHFRDWHMYQRYAIQKGFADDPRSCWDLIRLTRHGTIEFRMFGATRDIRAIVSWAKHCLELCAT